MWPPSVPDLCLFGLASATLAPEARQLVGANPSGSVFELRGHAFGGGENVRIVPASAGSVLPTGLSYVTRYIVNPPTDPDFFVLAGLTITDAGSGVLTLLRDLTAPALAILLDRKNYVEAHFKAYNPPWDTPPGWGVGVVCRLAAYDLATTFRVTSPQYSNAELGKRAAIAEAFCARGDRGEPYNDAQGPAYTKPEDPMGAVAVGLRGRGYIGGAREALTGERTDEA
jgi:hypothetical protein